MIIFLLGQYGLEKEYQKSSGTDGSAFFGVPSDVLKQTWTTNTNTSSLSAISPKALLADSAKRSVQ